MEANCREIGVKLAEIKTLRAELGDLIEKRQAKDAIRLSEQLTEKLELLKERCDPYQIRLRKEIAEKFEYDFVGKFDEKGMAWAKRRDEDGEDNDYLILKNGERVAGLFNNAQEFHEDLAQVEMPEVGLAVAFINREGKVITYESYTDAGHFSDGVVWVKKMGSVYFIDKKGELINDRRYQEVKNYCDGAALVKVATKWFLVDKAGEQIIEQSFKDASEFRDGWARVINGDSYSFVNSKGEFLEAPDMSGELRTRFDIAGVFSDGRAWLYEDGYYYVIDTSGKRITRASAKIKNFSDGAALVFDGEKSFFIDVDGQRLNDKEYGAGFAIHDYHDGVARVQEGGKVFFIDKKGDRISEDNFDLAEDFCDGLAKVVKDGESYYIDIKGRKVFEFK